ncbi:trehalose-phosphatase [soil metagenome]
MLNLPSINPDTALFLDFDGTLVEIAATPDSVIVPPDLPAVLIGLSAFLNGALCIVSGRTVKELVDYLAPADLTMAGEHGASFRAAGAEAGTLSPFWPKAWNEALDTFTANHPGTLVERKSRSVCIHFRLVPGAGEDALALASSLARDKSGKYEVLPAKMAFEVKQAGINKGQAVEMIMKRPPFQGRIPIFVGDDVTDEGGFAAAERHGGIGLHVERAFGNKPETVRSWLKQQLRASSGIHHDAA